MKNVASGSVASVVTSSFIISFFFKAILKKLWSMVNSRQVEAYMPMLESLKFPGNASLMNEYLIDLVTFDLIPTHLIDAMIHYFPDDGPFSVNQEECGNESIYLADNVGFMLWMIWAHLLLIVIHLVLCRVKKVEKRFRKYLYCNGLIRLYMEVF